MTAPVELLILADGDILYIMVSCLIFCQDQTVDIITTRGLIVARMLIHARQRDRVRLRFTVQHVLPIIGMSTIQHSILYVLPTRVLHDRDRVDSVTA